MRRRATIVTRRATCYDDAMSSSHRDDDAVERFHGRPPIRRGRRAKIFRFMMRTSYWCYFSRFIFSGTPMGGIAPSAMTSTPSLQAEGVSLLGRRAAPARRRWGRPAAAGA